MAIEYNYIKNITIDEELFSSKLDNLLRQEELVLGEITVQFVSDDYLLEMNNELLQHDYYTDIITMDFTVGELISGDLFVSIDRVGDNAKKMDLSFDKELLRVVLHGVLHLCGYGDATDEEKQEMRSKEDFYLS